MKQDLLASLRNGDHLSLKNQLMLIGKLSVPAVLAQLGYIIMTYIDAGMVGHLGKNASASIGLVSSSTWLVFGFCFACAMGFTVQTSHLIGAGKDAEARNLLKVSVLVSCCFASVVLAVLFLIEPFIVGWLGGDGNIAVDARNYFFICVCSVPLIMFGSLAEGMLQSSGNMKFPSLMEILTCVLNVGFNWIFIYQLKMGVRGAALASLLARLVTTCALVYYLFARSSMLKLRWDEKMVVKKEYFSRAVKIGIPVALEQIVMTGGHIGFTRIVSPLGNASIAANSLAITAEGLCYMPANGLGSAATTLTGQAYGANRKDLVYDLGWLCTWVGIAITVLTSVLMFVFAEKMMALMTPDSEVIALGAKGLRIVAFAETLYGASLVANGALRGTGDTFVPTILRFVSMWGVRIPLALWLASKYGLAGAWFAMSVELAVRGILMLWRMKGKNWAR